MQHKLALIALRKSVASKPCPADEVPCGRFWINGNRLGEMRLVFAEWKPGTRRLLESLYKLCCCLVAKSCRTLCNPVDCSLPASSVHGIFQARMFEWVAISSSRGSSHPRDRTRGVFCLSRTGKRILYHHATWEALYCGSVV